MRLVAVTLAGVALAMAADYSSEIAQWRRQREERLKADGGWLAVAGLFWLHEGANSFGRGENNQIVLPDGPAAAGVFLLKDGKVTVKTAGEERELWPDSLDFASAGRLKLYVIRRGDRFGIRLKDPDSDYRRNFHGIACFPASEAWRITARFVPDARDIPILNVLGQTEPLKSPGVAVFEIAGKEYRLRPVLESPDAQELFYIFKDQTSGRETYAAGRFLYSALPRDGRVVLDFNKAYNPPCAFTPYATCPLPPAENKLPVRIEAGEKKYGH